MASLTLADVRKKYPQASDLTDDQLLEVVAKQYGASVDEMKSILSYEAPAPRSRTWGDVASDALVTATKSAVGLPQAFVGLIDIPTGGRVGKALEEVGYRPNETQNMLSDMYSDPQKAANKQVNDAQGFTDTALAYIKNPSTIATTVGESAGQMLGGAGAARKLISLFPKLAPWAAGAIGEGLMGAGSAEEQLRAESPDGLTTAKQGAAALASGAGTALFGAAGGKIANSKLGQKLGIADIDTMLVSAEAMPKTVGFLKAAATSGISEGVLEEMPQSAWEQMMQNYAQDKPILEGVDKAMASGFIAGAAMGGGAGGFNSLMAKEAPLPKIEPPKSIMDQTDIDSVISAAESSVTQAPVVQKAATPIDDPMRLEVINQLPEQFRDAAIRAYNIITDEEAPKGIKKQNQKLLDDILEQASSMMQPQIEDAPKLDQPTQVAPIADTAPAVSNSSIDQELEKYISEEQAKENTRVLSDIENTDSRVAFAQEQAIATKRNEIIDQILSSDAAVGMRPAKLADIVKASMASQGYANPILNDSEFARIKRFTDIAKAEPVVDTTSQDNLEGQAPSSSLSELVPEKKVNASQSDAKIATTLPDNLIDVATQAKTPTEFFKALNGLKIPLGQRPPLMAAFKEFKNSYESNLIEPTKLADSLPIESAIPIETAVKAEIPTSEIPQGSNDVANSKTEIPSSETVAPTAIPESNPIVESKYSRGEVGGKLESGQIVLTASGRETTPFPQIKQGPRGIGSTLKQVDRWLITNAYNEAVARGDKFNALQFKDTSNIQQADKDSAELYLFGDSQPKVLPSIFKSKTAPETTLSETSLNDNGTLTIKGDSKAIQSQLKDAGIPSIPNKEGVIVGAKNAEKAQEVISSAGENAASNDGSFNKKDILPKTFSFTENALNNAKVQQEEIEIDGKTYLKTTRTYEDNNPAEVSKLREEAGKVNSVHLVNEENAQRVIFLGGKYFNERGKIRISDIQYEPIDAQEQSAAPTTETVNAPASTENGVKLTNPAQQTAAKKGMELPYKKGKTGAETARNRLAYENPFLSFLATHGVSILDRSDVGGEKGRPKLIAGHGPLFRKNGLRLDELAQLAAEKGFLTKAQIESENDNGGVNALSDMINSVMRNEVVTTVKDVAANRQADEQLQEEAYSLGIDITGKTGDEVYDLVQEYHREKGYQEAVDLLNELNQEYKDASAEYNLQELVLDIEEFENAEKDSARGQGATSEVAGEIDTRGTGKTESSSGSTVETPTKPAQESDAGGGDQGFRLTGETEQEASARLAKEDSDAKAKESETAKQDEADRKARIKKEIDSRQESSAENFQLGQSAEDSLSGQRDIFADNQTEAAKEQIHESDLTPAEKLANIAAVNRGDVSPDDIAKVFGTGQKIDDLGEKIGGARKDNAGSTNSKTSQKPKVAEQDDPAWRRRYVAIQKIVGSNTTSFASNGKWAIQDTRTGKVAYGTNFATQEEAENAIPLYAVSQKHKVQIESRNDEPMQFGIWRQVSDTKRVKVVKQSFDTREEAMKYMADHAAEIIETKTSYREELFARPEKVMRQGKERRTGNVDGNDFIKTFGFRGVEFGNWNNQVERQELLNHAYDGLMDLAEILNIPNKAISLNGDLGLAFGARGQGLTGAAAHYERDYAVINLTKMSGAGSLAHEWFHAFDHYLGRLDGKASSEKVLDKKGNPVFDAKGRENDYASHGFQYDSRSKARKEIRDLYEDLIKGMFSKAETYVEDTVNAEKFVKKTRDSLEAQLKKIRDNLSSQLDERYYKRKNKPASPEQLMRFDAIAESLINGENLETSYSVKEGGRNAISAGYLTNSSLQEISDIYKDVRGRSGHLATREGICDVLQGHMARYLSRIKIMKDAETGGEKVKRAPTSYRMDATEIDQGSASDYWSTPHEMAARAFSAYVEDKVSEQDGKSDFLSYGSSNGFYALYGVRPFPAGAERTAINASFDKLFAALKTKETEKGVALYSKKRSQNNSQEVRGQISEEVGSKFRELVKKNGDAFQFDKLTGDKDLGKTLRQIGIPTGVSALTKENDNWRDGQDQQWQIKSASGDVAYVYRKSNEVQINVSKLKSTKSKGSEIYQAVESWAFANNYKFIGDSQGITGTGQIRRTENMISSILRHDSIDHVKPHDESKLPVDQGGLDIQWFAGNRDRSLGELLVASYKNIERVIPEIKYVHATKFGDFEYRGSPTHADGDLFTADDIERLADEYNKRELSRAGGDSKKASRVGSNTLTRAIYAGTLYRNAAATYGAELYDRGEYARTDGANEGIGPEGLTRTLYSRKGTIDVDGINRPTTDSSGKALAATEEGIKNFWRWFGDSKIVDSSGKPLAAYHASEKEISEFKSLSYGTSGNHEYFYFAKSKGWAERFFRETRYSDGVIHKVFLSIKNPLDLRVEAKTGQQWINFFEDLGVEINEFKREKLIALGRREIPAWGVLRFDTPMMGNIRQELINLGYDGLILEDTARGKNDPTTFVALSATQIKSATSNSGNFEQGNSNILYSRKDQTQSQEFKNWFGDSEVVDADGKPLIVYHGTTKDIDTFRASQDGMFGKGIYLTKSSSKASRYADPRGGADNANVIPVFVRAKNLWNVSDKNGLAPRDVYVGDNSDVVDQLIADGYDGIINGDEIVVFNPNQVKSAIGNNGEFSADNPNILYSRKEKTDSPEFKKWFGKSKVVDDNGDPLVLYHGTMADFHTFDPQAKRKEGNKRTTINSGMFLSKSKEFASGYANREGGNVMPVYAKVTNPFDWKNEEHIKIALDAYKKRFGEPMFDSYAAELKKRGWWASLEGDLVNILIRDHGFDGIWMTEGGATNLYVPNPNQIKSAVGNNGEFDPNNPDIRYSKNQNRNVSGKTVSDFAPLAKKYNDKISKNGFELVVVQSETDLPDNSDAVNSAGDEKIEGAYLSGNTAYIVADSISTNKRFDEVAQHELSHLATEKLLSSDEWARGLRSIQTLERMNNKTLTKLGEIVDKEQPGLDAETRAREIAALLVETGEYKNVSVLDKLVSSLTMKLKAMLRSMGLNNNWVNSLNEGEVSALLRSAMIRLYGGAEIKNSESSGNTLFSKSGNDKPLNAANPHSWNAPEPSRFDDLLYKYQDKQIDTKRVIDSIDKNIADDLNVYQKEELFHNRAASRVKEFINKEQRPLLNSMKELGIDMPTLEEYLHARTAEETNILIAWRNRDTGILKDGGSGMKTADARKYLASLDPALRKNLESLAAKVDAITEETRQLYVDYGLESKDTVDGWRDMFDHYVPLMREQEGETHGMGVGQGFSVKGKEVKGRTGSTRKVVDIFANIAMQREKVIVRGEKNKVAKALLDLATATPNPDFWSVDKPETKRVYDPDTDSVKEQSDPLFKSRENVIVAKVQGAKGKIEEKAIIFNETNARAMRMVTALKNLDTANMNGFMGGMAKITRYFSAINTQYNPIFGVVNLTRDLQGAMVNLTSTPLKDQKAQVAKHTLSALKAIYLDERAGKKGNQIDSEMAALWREFELEGGPTGYREMFANSADRAEAIESELNPTKWMDSPLGKVFTANGMLKVPLAQAQKQAKGLFGVLEDYNNAMENSVRLAAYKVAKDQGLSKEKAASLAKNLTVNFNRKGQVAQQVGAFYAFFNASMQGTARHAKTLFTIENGDITTTRLSSTGKKIVYGGVLIGVVQALMLAAAGFDDDEPPQFVRERSLVIPTGWTGLTPEKGYINIPMPLGLHILPNIGRISSEFALGGFKRPADKAFKLMGLTVDAFNPTGGGGSLLQAVTPTAVDPIAAISENKDWTGKPIAKTSHNKALPGHALMKDTASYPSKVISEGINYLTGGTQYTAGAVSPTPDQVDYLFGQVTGGVGREATKMQQSISTVMTGEDLPINKIPLVGRFYGNAESQSSQANRFYSNLDRLNEHETEIKGMMKDRKGLEVARYLRDNPEARMYEAANQVERAVQQLRQRKRELIKSEAEPSKIKAIDEQIKLNMARFNESLASISKGAN